MQDVIGVLFPVLVYVYIFILNLILPGRWVTGYVTKPNSSEKLRYRLNGLYVLFTVVFSWVLLCYYGIMDWDWLYLYRWHGLVGAILFGLAFSFAIVIPAPKVRNNFIADFFLGRLENPQLWGGKVDAKMWLYLVGAVMLSLNVLSFTAHHHLQYGDMASSGIFLAALFLLFFIVDYLSFEEVHLYTYDFFAERVGFKLGWGCLAFYPYFYAIPLWAVVSLPASGLNSYWFIPISILFFSSWVLARGTNLQKYYFKKDPSMNFMGIKPEVITDGKKSLLVSGFWGLSRHINYLGEIGMATAIVLATGYADVFWGWLYPLYYVVLLFTRQADDDKRCALKYGPLWQQYIEKVPYKIIPYIY
jgi:hypothetical protein